MPFLNVLTSAFIFQSIITGIDNHITLPGVGGGVNVHGSGLGTAATGDCCDKCADDEACKIDKNGCECWKPSTNGNLGAMETNKSPESDHIPLHGVSVHGSGLGTAATGDCCDKCADDEACKIGKNGCECWKPSTANLAFFKVIASPSKVADLGRTRMHALARQFKTSVSEGDLARATAAQLQGAAHMLPGLSPTDITAVSVDAFRGAFGAFRDQAEKLGAFTAQQTDALRGKLQQAFGPFKDLTAKVIAEMGSLGGMLSDDDLKAMEPAAAAALPFEAMKTMGGRKAGRVFSTHSLKMLTKTAKRAFNGKDLVDLVDADKIKAVLDCGNGCNTIKAVADVVIDYDAGEKTVEQLKNQILAAAAALYLPLSSVSVVQEAVSVMADTVATPTLRRLRAAASGQAETTVRITGDSVDTVTQVGTAGAAATGGQAFVVDLSVGDEFDAAAWNGDSQGTLSVAVLLVAAARVMM